MINEFSNKKVLITGIAGFIGTNLANKLSSTKGIKIYGIDRKNDFIHKNKIKFYKIISSNYDEIEKYIELIKPDIVFHLAGNVNLSRDFRNTTACIEDNIKMSVNLLESLRKHPPKRLIFTSTCEVYDYRKKIFTEKEQPFPISPYAISKLSSELYCRMYYLLYKLPIVILRLSYVYGPNQNKRRLVPSIILACKNKKKIKITKGDQIRDFNYVEDVVNALILAAIKKDAIGETINIGQKNGHSILDIVSKINKIMGNKSKIEIGAISNRPYEAKIWEVDGTKAKKILGWEHKTNIEKGLEKTIDFYKNE